MLFHFFLIDEHKYLCLDQKERNIHKGYKAYNCLWQHAFACGLTTPQVSTGILFQSCDCCRIDFDKCRGVYGLVMPVIFHDDVIKWKHFTRNWPFVRGIHRSPVNSPHKGQWCGALMFSLICVWITDWVNNREAGDLRRYRAHHDVTVMCYNL